MSPLRPRSHLETHNVVNQPPVLEGANLLRSDVALTQAITCSGGTGHLEGLASFGERTGSTEIARWAREANEFPPRLKAFDRFGRRIDEVEFHPAWHALMKLGLVAGVASAA